MNSVVALGSCLGKKRGLCFTSQSSWNQSFAIGSVPGTKSDDVVLKVLYDTDVNTLMVVMCFLHHSI